ncbi:MAG: PepSY-associated TM helix domain-containing protein [Parvibaculum sp.]|nr:PepSY-associated TM helix domain-containing protein [Parvibaculum sp.]
MTNGAIRAWYQVHKWTSLVCTVFLLMLCITGLPLIFHEEIDHLLEGEQTLTALPADTPMRSLDEALATALKAHPGEVPLFMSFDEDRPVVNVTTALSVTSPVEAMNFTSLDLRTAEIVAQGNFATDGVMDFILQLHIDMFLGLKGELFLGFMGLLFFTALVSGVVVYAPFMRRLNFGTVRAARPRLKWLDTHNLIGVVTLMWAVVVGLTGVINTLATPLTDYWRFTELADMIAPYEGQPVPTQMSSLNEAVLIAKAAAPGTRPQFVAFPGVRFSSNHHYAVWLKGATPATEQILTPALIDATNGTLTDIRKMPWYMLALRLSQPLHFGDYGGMPMKILWALLDIATIIMLSTGVWLWLAKRKSSTPRIAVTAQVKPAE